MITIGVYNYMTVKATQTQRLIQGLYCPERYFHFIYQLQIDINKRDISRNCLKTI